MVAGVLLLLGSGVSGEGDFEDGEESLLPDGDESLLSGLIDINNFLLGDVDNLVLLMTRDQMAACQFADAYYDASN